MANFLLAILLFAGLFVTIGQPVGGTGVGAVVEASAAAQAGLKAGDEITALDGQKVNRFEQVQRYVQPRAGQPIAVRVLRDGAEQTLTAVPEAREDAPGKVGVLGIQGGAARVRPAGSLLGRWSPARCRPPTSPGRRWPGSAR